MEEKDTGIQSYQGKITKLYEKYLEIQTNITLEKLSNVKISLPNNLVANSDNDIYTKVIEVYPNKSNTYKLNITSATGLRIEGFVD